MRPILGSGCVGGSIRRTVSMREALDDPQLLGDALIGDSWSTWRVFLIALLGDRLTGFHSGTIWHL